MLPSSFFHVGPFILLLTFLPSAISTFSSLSSSASSFFPSFSPSSSFSSSSSVIPATSLALTSSSGLDGPVFLDKFSEQTIEPGSSVSVSLRCIASGHPLPQVTWLLDGQTIPDHSRFRTGDYVTRDSVVVSYVNITSITAQDGGLYECTANNEVGQIKHSGRLKIFGPPHIRSMENASAVSGESYVVHCPVTGHPIESIYWEKDKQRLPFNHRQKVYPNGTLVLADVDRLVDQGSYTCVALSPSSNGKNGMASSTLHLSVQMKPVIDAFTFSKSLHEGLRYNVLCSVTRGDSPLTIKWFKDGRLLGQSASHQLTNIPSSTEYSGINVIQVTEFSSSLIFESLRPDHRGNYTCQASNKAGTAAITQSMIVHVPPKWIIEPRDTSILTGKTAVIDCQADGFPHPTVHWTRKEGQSESSEFKPVISGSHLRVFQNGSLAIHSVQKIDSASYLCQVTNGIGTGLSKVIKLTVHIPAHFKSKFRAETVRKGQDALIRCEGEGDRPLTISWTKDKNPLKTKDDVRYESTETASKDGIISEIVIKSAERRDSALFTCIASNPYGEDETNIQLIMQEPPDPPQDIKVIRLDGRSAQISWSPPYSGNSPIVNYIIQHKAEFSATNIFNSVSSSVAAAASLSSNSNSVISSSGPSSSGQDSTSGSVSSSSISSTYTNTTVSGAESSALIRNLKPIHSYEVRVIAINSLGKSEGSELFKFTTEEEAPGGPPLHIKALALSSKSIRVTWKPPRVDLQYGHIKGYYVGYKVFHSEADSFIYKTLEVDSPDFSEATVLTSLKKFTKYAITVQAFNSKGTGPASEIIEVQTLQNDPPPAPVVKVAAVTTSSIRVVWTVPGFTDASSSLTSLASNSIESSTSTAVSPPQVNGFILHAKKQESSHEWEEVRLSGDRLSHTFERLACGSRYQYYLEAFNAVGKSDPSEVLTAKTEGSPPVAPDRHSLISANTTSAILYLDSWHDGSCPISSFEISFKSKKSRGKPETMRVFPAEAKVTVLRDLLPATVYEVKVTAINEVAPTEHVYTFSTLSSIRAPVLSGNEASVSFTPPIYLDASLILPTTISIVMVILLIFVIRIWLLKKRQSSSSHNGSGNFYGTVYGLSDLGSSNCAMKKINGSVGCVNSGAINGGANGVLCSGPNGGNSNCESGNGNGSDIAIPSSIGGCLADSSVLCYPSPYEMTKLANGAGNSSTLAMASHLTSHHGTTHHLIHSSNGGVNGNCGDIDNLTESESNLVDHLSSGLHGSPMKGSLLDCGNNEPMYATVKRTPRAPRTATNETCHVYQYPLTLSSLLQNNHHSMSNNGGSIAGSESCFGDTESCLSLSSTTNGTVGPPTSTAYIRITDDSNDKGLTAEDGRQISIRRIGANFVR